MYLSWKKDDHCARRIVKALGLHVQQTKCESVGQQMDQQMHTSCNKWMDGRYQMYYLPDSWLIKIELPFVTQPSYYPYLQCSHLSCLSPDPLSMNMHPLAAFSSCPISPCHLEFFLCK